MTPLVAPRQLYVRELLRLYLATPGVAGHIRRADRQLAAQLYDRRVPLFALANAFLLAAHRRVRHNAFSSPLPPVRCLHYFLPVLREVLDRPPGYREIDQMRRALGLGDPPL